MIKYGVVWEKPVLLEKLRRTDHINGMVKSIPEHRRLKRIYSWGCPGEEEEWEMHKY